MTLDAHVHTLHSGMLGSAIGLPLVCLPLIGAAVHFIEEARFKS